MRPVHENPCSTCVLVGQLTAPIMGDPSRSITWDFYLCETTDPVTRSVIARYGSRHGDQIVSIAPLAGLAFDTTKWPLNVGAQLVLARGRTA